MKNIKINIPVKETPGSVNKSVYITEKQKNWIEKHNVNLSKLVRQLLDQLINTSNEERQGGNNE